MDPPRTVVTTVVVGHVELAPLIKNVAEEVAPANPTALADNAVMTAVVETLVVLVLMVKPVMEVFVLELQSEVALEDSVVTTETEEAVVVANPDKDAEAEFASATMDAITETVVLPLNPLVQSAHNKVAEPAPLDTPVQLKVFATNHFLVIFQSKFVMVSPTSLSVHHAQLLLLVLPITLPISTGIHLNTSGMFQGLEVSRS